MIEQAYEQAEAAGIVQLNEDEAGPYQAIPQPGASWQPEGHPGLLPHEYERGGTAKLLTLFRPASGQLRAQGVVSVTNLAQRATGRRAGRDRAGASSRCPPAASPASVVRPVGSVAGSPPAHSQAAPAHCAGAG